MRSLQPGAQARHSYARTFPPLIYPERTRPSLSSTVDKSSAGYPLRPVVPKPSPDRWLRAVEIYLHDVHGGFRRFGNLGSFCLATRLPRRTSPWLETRRAGSTACAQGHRVTAGRRCGCEAFHLVDLGMCESTDNIGRVRDVLPRPVAHAVAVSACRKIWLISAAAARRSARSCPSATMRSQACKRAAN